MGESAVDMELPPPPPMFDSGDGAEPQFVKGLPSSEVDVESVGGDGDEASSEWRWKVDPSVLKRPAVESTGSNPIIEEPPRVLQPAPPAWQKWRVPLLSGAIGFVAATLLALGIGGGDPPPPVEPAPVPEPIVAAGFVVVPVPYEPPKEVVARVPEPTAPLVDVAADEYESPFAEQSAAPVAALDADGEDSPKPRARPEKPAPAAEPVAEKPAPQPEPAPAVQDEQAPAEDPPAEAPAAGADAEQPEPPEPAAE